MPVIIKNQNQIDSIRKASQLAAATLDFIEPYVKPGITTLEIDTLIHDFTREHGARPACLNYRGFPKSVCTSLNEVVCHGIPNEKDVLKEGDIINVDVTSILNGFYGDTSKMFAVGNISEEAQKLVSVTKRCLEIGIEQVRPGNMTGLIGFQIAKYAESCGYSVVEQFGGHGVGLAFHEEPFINHKSHPEEGVMMQAGMTFTIEPMLCTGTSKTKTLSDGWTAVTKDKGLSAQFEHTVLVTTEGVEILTLNPDASDTIIPLQS